MSFGWKLGMGNHSSVSVLVAPRSALTICLSASWGDSNQTNWNRLLVSAMTVCTQGCASRGPLRSVTLNNDADAVDPLIYNVLTRIIGLPCDEEGVFASRKVMLSPDAVREFEKFRQFLHGVRGGFEGREREWLAKTPSHVLRLAGTLAYIHWAIVGGAEPTELDVASLASAVRLVRDYFWPHSRAALRCVGLSDRETNARVVIKWMIENQKAELSVQDVRERALCRAVDAQETEAILKGLVDHGFLQRVAEEPGKKRGRPSVRWLVNPAALSARNPRNPGNPTTD
jgi:hypothetical protein